MGQPHGSVARLQDHGSTLLLQPVSQDVPASWHQDFIVISEVLIIVSVRLIRSLIKNERSQIQDIKKLVCCQICRSFWSLQNWNLVINIIVISGIVNILLKRIQLRVSFTRHLQSWACVIWIFAPAASHLQCYSRVEKCCAIPELRSRSELILRCHAEHWRRTLLTLQHWYIQDPVTHAFLSLKEFSSDPEEIQLRSLFNCLIGQNWRNSSCSSSYFTN